MELSPPLIGRWSTGSWSDATEPAQMDVNGNKAGKMCLPGFWLWFIVGARDLVT